MKPASDILARLRNGEIVRFDDPEYLKLRDVSFATRKLLVRLNQSTDSEEMRALLSQITEIDASTAIDRLAENRAELRTRSRADAGLSGTRATSRNC